MCGELWFHDVAALSAELGRLHMSIDVTTKYMKKKKKKKTTTTKRIRLIWRDMVMADVHPQNPVNDAKAILADASRALHGDWNKDAWSDHRVAYRDLAFVNKDPADLKRVTGAMQNDRSVIDLEHKLGISVAVKPDGSLEIKPTDDHRPAGTGPNEINYKPLDRQTRI